MQKVMKNLAENRALLRKENEKLEKLQCDSTETKLNIEKLKQKEERLRDIYDFVYRKHYMGSKININQFKTALQKHLNTYKNEPTKRENNRVNLPSCIDENK